MNDFEKVKEIISDSIEALNEVNVDPYAKIGYARASFIEIHKVLFGCKPGAKSEEQRPKKGAAHGS